ncbi:MAG: hypothetical protein ACC645_13675, partial [Pirellulales bacterium]
VPGSKIWINLGGGDGGDVAVDTSTMAGNGQSIRYTSSQTLLSFVRTVWDASGSLLSSVGLNYKDPTTGLKKNTVGDLIIPQFKTTVELNAINPERLILGAANFPYESVNKGDSITQLDDDDVGTIDLPVNGNGDPIAYGGMIGGSPNEALLYVGSGSEVFVRTAAASDLVAKSFPGATVRDIVLDPDDGTISFVVDDAGDVYMGTNTGGTWTKITGNLTGLGATDIRSIEFVPGTTDDSVVVGTNTGVFRAKGSDSYTTWAKVGTAVPNALVYDMDYAATDDVLIAGTLGRGAWKLSNASKKINA